MPVSPRISRRISATVLAAAAVIALLTSCTTTGRSSLPAAPMRDQVAANLHTYAGVSVSNDVAYERVDGVSLRLNVCLPPVKPGVTASARPAIVEIHGGSWAFDDKSDPDWQDVCEWLASAGYVTANVDYRLAPRYPYPDAIHDVEHAVEWLRKPAQVRHYNLDPARIGAFGGSAGGNLASLLGTSGSGSTSVGHRVAAVAEMSGPMDLTTTGLEHQHFYRHVLAYLGCKTFTHCPDAAAASPVTHIDPSDPPFFVSHSTRELIPLAQADELVNQLDAEGVKVTFVTLTGAKHSIAALDYPMRKRILAFYRAYLHGSAAAVAAP